jgi:hypothetical protein
MRADIRRGARGQLSFMPALACRGCSGAYPTRRSGTLFMEAASLPRKRPVPIPGSL